MQLTGGEALARALCAEQIPLVTGVVGGKLAPFIHAISRIASMRFVGTRHEGHAAMMASAVFAASGKLGVVVGECGGGGGNLVPGIAIANTNNLAMLVVTSNNQHAASYPRRGMFAEMDTESVFAPITKWNTAVHDGRRLPELAHRALRTALTGRPGPVHLDVPQDILRNTFEFDESAFPTDPAAYRITCGPAATAMQVEAAAQLLARATRPLLIAGGGVTASGATNEFRAVGRILGAAMIATQMGCGNVRSDDPGYLGLGWVAGGEAVHRACQEADVVLAVGCRFSSWMWGEHGTLLGPDSKLIHIDIDPEVIGKEKAVAVGICADARLALESLGSALLARLPAAPTCEWLQELKSTYRSHLSKLRELSAQREAVMHPATLAQHVAECLPGDSLVTFDGGHTTFWSNSFTPVVAPRTRFNEPGMSQLGFGLPWALTLQLLNPDRRVFNLTGDGSFGFTLQELDTARRFNLPVVNVIHNNASWGIIRSAYQRSGFDVGTQLDGTDYAAIARGFGCYGEVVTQPDEIKPALTRALDSGLPAVIDCRVSFVPHPGLPAFARMSSAGA